MKTRSSKSHSLSSENKETQNNQNNNTEGAEKAEAEIQVADAKTTEVETTITITHLSNITDLKKMLEFNLENRLFFFRIGSEMVPFASHSKFKDSFDWKKHFDQDFKSIGDFVKQHSMRISMHPDQFVLINSPSEDIQERSVAELQYHCDFLEALGLDSTHKIQIHVGGVYGDKESAIQRFVDRYKDLSDSIKKRLVIENDDRLYSLKDCMQIHEKTQVPILFDNLHHECLNNGEPMIDAIKQAMKTWNKEKDGIMLMDYSSQEPGARKGRHTEHINIKHFKQYLKEIEGIEADIMLEIKDKENSALKAVKLIRGEDLVVEKEETVKIVETRTKRKKTSTTASEEPTKKSKKKNGKSKSDV